MGQGARVAAVVVTWIETETTLRCLRSVLAAQYPNGFIVVVDNGTPEDPTDAFRSLVPDVEVIRLRHNFGYPAAANAGARRAISMGAEYLLFLNNDATIDRDTIPALLADSRNHPLAIHAPRIVYEQNPACVWSAGGYVIRPWMKSYHIGEGEPAAAHRGSHHLDWATGCALFLPVAAYERTGPFDEELFLYLEDVDWCLRASSRGIPTRYVGDAMVRHAVSTTVGRRLSPAHVRYYAYRNYYRVAFRHAPIWARPLVAIQLGWTLLKIAMRWAAFPSYRRDLYYHARTQAILDVLRGRWGPAPPTVAPSPPVAPVEVALSSRTRLS